MSPSLHGFVAALAATVIWAGNFVVARGIAHAIPPIQLNFWRWLLALACILPWALPRLRAEWPVMRRAWRHLLVMAFFGVALLNTLIYKAGQTTQSLNMALLVPTAPVIIMVLSRVLYGEPITWRRLTGMVVVLLGVLTLLAQGHWGRIAAVRFNAGDLWALAGAACFALYSLFARGRPRELSIAGYNAAYFSLGLVMLLPGLVVEMAVLPAPDWSPAVLLGVAYAGIGCSSAAYLLWTRAIAGIGPVAAGMVYYSLPLFAAVESAWLLGEPIAAYHMVGGVLVVSGIVLATAGGRGFRPPRPGKRPGP
ncbi:MAG: DMT family transporter [Solidesulfovibrio sp.]|jgi:drug/metabolite transporter (DMT)-like permease|uniref:DMT family transporter n=1 Tax=Solidesulfovibrio sp. TaxID=2910990 RepID=UPI003158CBAC